MTGKTSSVLKGAAAGMIAGGAAFWAVKTFTCEHNRTKRTATKAMKMVEGFIDSMM